MSRILLVLILFSGCSGLSTPPPGDHSPPQVSSRGGPCRCWNLIFLGDVSAARHELEFFRSRQINSPLIDVAEARLDRMEGHPEQALAVLNRIWSSVSNSPRVIWLRGRIYLDLGNLQAAADDFNLVLVSMPTDEIQHFNLADSTARNRLASQAQVKSISSSNLPNC